MFTIERKLEKVNEFPEDRIFKVEKLGGYEYEEDDSKKYRTMSIKGLGIPPLEYTAQGLPSVDTEVLEKLSKGVAKSFMESQNQPEFG